jgi:hypothetical protein
VFISVKGMYYQVEVHGQTITWLMPHQFPHFVSRDVDFRIMDTFVEFYITLITFVNYKLFNSFNLRYPPQIDGLTAPDSALMLPSLLFNPIELDYEETSDKGAYRDVMESYHCFNLASLLYPLSSPYFSFYSSSNLSLLLSFTRLPTLLFLHQMKSMMTSLLIL